MRRLRVRYRPEALADLDDIYHHIYRVSFSPATANDIISRIRARCNRIGLAPNGGRPRDDLALGLRTVPFEGKAVVAYQVDDDCVRIVNIFYGRKDFEALYARHKTSADEDES